VITSTFRYIEPLWIGNNKKISIRRLLSLVFSCDFVGNTHHAIYKWEIGKSYADVAMLLGIEAALIAALLSLTTYSATFLNRNPDYTSQYTETNQTD